MKNIIISEQISISDNYKYFLELVEEKKINVIVIKMGDRIDIEKDIYFSFIWPNNNQQILENTLNNNSIVCKLNYKSFSMLFTGDIEKIAESKIIEEYNSDKSNLKATVLKVAHHGSKTSSCKELIELIKPTIAVIGVGKKNKFGHPNSEVLDTMRNIRSKDI
ncbi:MAG: hypothetical protein IKE01_04620 [Clostridia bacterium]|nr:hypothetical protein [Clostridia bacterium]